MDNKYKEKHNIELFGSSLSIGIAVGEVLLVEQYGEFEVPVHGIEKSDVENEILRYKNAVERCKTDIKGEIAQISETLGEQGAEIFEAHIGILNDPAMEGEVIRGISESLENVESIIWKTNKKYEEIFESIDDEYLREKVFDIREVCQRILDKLLFIGEYSLNSSKKVILFATHLTPALLFRRNWDNVMGVVTEKGSITSHMAIMIRSLGVPSVINVPGITKVLRDGSTVIIDGQLGKVTINPDSKKLVAYSEIKNNLCSYQKKLKEIKDLPTVTRDDVPVKLLANIGKSTDVPIAMDYNVDGIGLFRSEFFFMSSKVLPTEEAQYKYYKSVAEKCKGKEVTIRLLDIGADKPLPFIKLPEQSNPSLGSRGIRVIDYHPEIFMAQVKALLRVAFSHPIKILVPMVSNIKEIYDFKEFVIRCSEELKDDNVKHSSKVQLGIMVEVPSLIFSLDSIAPLVDFLSIGTNDLTQYLLAADRFDGNMSSYYLPHDPSIFKAIAKISEVGQQHGIPVCVCGEIAGNPKFTKALLGLGIKSFSFEAHNALFIKDIIKRHTIDDCVRYADTILGLSSSESIEAFMECDYAAYLAGLEY